MGKSTISMAIFNSYVSLPEGNQHQWHPHLTGHQVGEAHFVFAQGFQSLHDEI